MSSRTWLVVATVVGVVGLGVQQFAVAGVPVPIDGVDLNGPGPTIWNPDNDTVSPSCNTLLPDGFYTPTENGSFGVNGDAFDGALIMSVNGTFFKDPDVNGNETGEQLKVGPATVKGLQVSRTELALGTSPTLRDLVKLKNTSNKNRNRTIVVGSDVGTDDATIIASTSSGDTIQTTNDRWVVSTNALINDPPVTHVFYGKHAQTKVTSVAQALGSGVPPEVSCDVVSFQVKVPAHSTAYLLFFLEMHDQSAGGLATAISDAGMFNDRNLSAPLLTGLPNGVRDKILNWDLT